MSHFTTFANDLLDAEYDTGGSGTLALGPVSSRVNYTLPILVELTTTVSSSGSPGTAVAGGSYAPQPLTSSMAAAASASKASSAALTFSGMPSCTWADVRTKDSTGTPKNMNFRGGASLAKTVNVGDTALIPSGSFVGTE